MVILAYILYKCICELGLKSDRHTYIKKAVYVSLGKKNLFLKENDTCMGAGLNSWEADFGQ